MGGHALISSPLLEFALLCVIEHRLIVTLSILENCGKRLLSQVRVCNLLYYTDSNTNVSAVISTTSKLHLRLCPVIRQNNHRSRRIELKQVFRTVACTQRLLMVLLMYANLNRTRISKMIVGAVVAEGESQCFCQTALRP